MIPSTIFRNFFLDADNFIDLPRDLLDIGHAVRRDQDVLVAIVRQQRRGLAVIGLQALGHGFGLVVLAAGKLGGVAFVANAGFLRLLEAVMRRA